MSCVPEYHNHTQGPGTIQPFLPQATKKGFPNDALFLWIHRGLVRTRSVCGVYTVIWQGKQVYSHKRCVDTVLANPQWYTSSQQAALAYKPVLSMPEFSPEIAAQNQASIHVVTAGSLSLQTRAVNAGILTRNCCTKSSIDTRRHSR